MKVKSFLCFLPQFIQLATRDKLELNRFNKNQTVHVSHAAVWLLRSDYIIKIEFQCPVLVQEIIAIRKICPLLGRCLSSDQS